MAVDHCFSIRGQGTVMTGTVLQGSLAVNDTVEIPALKVSRWEKKTKNNISKTKQVLCASINRASVS